MLLRRGRSCGTLFSFSQQLQCRPFATDPKAYSKTLLLPKTKFPLWSSPKDSELPFRKKTTEDLYAWQVSVVCRVNMGDGVDQGCTGREPSWSTVRPSRWAAVCKREPSYGCVQCLFIVKLCLKHAPYIGHALNKIVKDIINRYQVIRGRRVKCVLH